MVENLIIDDFQEEENEELRDQRNRLFSQLPQQVLRSIERIMDELTDELNLNKRRVQSRLEGMTEREMMEQHLEAERQKSMGVSKLQSMMNKPKRRAEDQLHVKQAHLHREYKDRFRQCLSGSSYTDIDKELIVKESLLRAFKEAVKRSDKMYFLMKENY